MDDNITRGLNTAEFAHVICKRKLLIISFTLMITIFGIAFGIFRGTHYEAKGGYFLGGPESLDKNVIIAYEEIIKSETFARQVSNYTEQKVPLQMIQESLAVGHVGDRIITINITGGSPDYVLNIFNSVTQAFINAAPTYYPVIKVQPIDYPTYESVSSHNPIYLFAITAFLAGLIMSLALVIFLNYLDGHNKEAAVKEVLEEVKPPWISALKRQGGEIQGNRDVEN